MTAIGPAEDSGTDRRVLAHSLRTLLAHPDRWPLPFAGDYLAFQHVFGNRLVVEIDPRPVTHQLPPHRQIGGQTVRAADFVLGRGRWLPLLEPLDRSVIHREVADLLACGGNYRETPAHAALMARLKAGDPGVRNLQRLDTSERIDAYFEDLQRLIASIRDTGYRRRPAYDGIDSAEQAMAATSPVRPVLVELTESEIGMAVDADGRLVRVGPGNHRMAIARQLGLLRIPVEFRLFHVAWIRRHMAQGQGLLQVIVTGVRAIAAQQPNASSGETA